MERMLEHKPVREASHVFSQHVLKSFLAIGKREAQSCAWDWFPRSPGLHNPRHSTGAGSKWIIVCIFDSLAFTVGSPQRFFLKTLLHSPVCISGLTHLLLLIFYLCILTLTGELLPQSVLIRLGVSPEVVYARIQTEHGCALQSTGNIPCPYRRSKDHSTWTDVFYPQVQVSEELLLHCTESTG